jgi:uncharacterized RDD family membrane protein YckC
MKRLATFWQRLAATGIDLLILLPIGLIHLWLDSLSRQAALALAVPLGFVGVGYSLYAHGRYGQTVGKWAMGIRVVQVTSEPIGWRHAWLRSSVDLLFCALWVIGRTVALATIPDLEYDGLGWSKRTDSIVAHEPIWSIWAMRFEMVWFWSEVVTMLFNRQRRALHDFLAGTLVVDQGRRSQRVAAEQADEPGGPAAATS